MAATRWGIAGTGKIASDFLNAMSSLPAADHEVAAVVGRTPSHTQQLAAQFNIPKVYHSYKEMATDPDIDVVYVSTITPIHFELCKVMVEAGKNVLCEKPMTMNMEDTKTVLTLAKEKDVFFLEAVWSRFFPAYDKLREELSKKTIGDVKYVSAGLGFNIMKHMKHKELDSGAMLTLGVYGVQFALLVFGNYPERIIASGILTDTGVDEATFLTLHFSEGGVAQLQCHIGADLSNNAEIIGTKGKIHIPHFWAPDCLTICGKSEEFPLPTTTAPKNFPHSEGLAYEAEAVRQCLLKGRN